jgi:elongation factor P--beta-lysine ligase
VVDYPPSQAALARLRCDADGQPVAARFELYFRGVELANGYHELLDADEQRARFAADLREREANWACRPSPSTSHSSPRWTAACPIAAASPSASTA